MDLQLTEEHKMIRDMAREFAQKEIAPVAAHFDETGEFPYETVKKMGAQGFMGIEVPEEYGGQGLDTIAYVLAMEEIAKADVAHSTIVSVHNSLYAHGLIKFGTEEQKQTYLAPVATGRKDRRVQPDRTHVRLGRGDDEIARGAQRRLLRDQRRQVVGHVRAGGRLYGPVHHDRPWQEASRRHRLHH